MGDDLKILLVEDDDAVRLGMLQALQLAEIGAEAFATAEEAGAALHPGFPGVLVSDVRLPGMDGLALMRRALGIDPDLPVILITGHGDISMAVDAMRGGAYDFIEKPFSSERLIDTVRRALEKRRLTLEVAILRRKLRDRDGIDAVMLGESQPMARLKGLILRIADTAADVLINGETGTGKELVARCLHQFSGRRDRNFVAVNCGALPETVFESEVFGHEAGAFTGALRQRIGKVEHADGGTLFLDEIESMPLSLQVKLLRVLQERTVERLGSNRNVAVDLRVIAATKENLAERSRRKEFRSDLYYRLNVIQIDLPPLRDRRDDIPLLFEHFVLQAAIRYRREAPAPTGRQMHQLLAHRWPGNVRELRNIADRFVLGMAGDGFDQLDTHPPQDLSLGQQVEIFERSLIAEEMRRHAGNVSAVGETLKVPKKTLYDKLQRHGLTIDEFR